MQMPYEKYSGVKTDLKVQRIGDTTPCASVTVPRWLIMSEESMQRHDGSNQTEQAMQRLLQTAGQVL
jgi:hypothetical protein